MAIQIPNPGTGNGASGDNEFVLWTKVKDNFSNTEHAASKMVGVSSGKIPLAEDAHKAAFGYITSQLSGVIDLDTLEVGTTHYIPIGTALNKPDNIASGYAWVATIKSHTPGLKVHFQMLVGISDNVFAIRSHVSSYLPWRVFYSDKNTTIGTNKEIVTSSPVVRVFSDKIEAIHEAKDLPLEFIRNSEGDYTLKGTTGLRDGQNDWQIIIPKDDHDNQLIAFTIEDNGGTIKLKTYKRTFSMETFTFGPDLSTPLDIPEGRWVDLHFNDIPQEQLDEPIE